MENNQPRQEWEERFEEMEKNHGWLPEHKERITFFISATLASERKALLEELLKELPKEMDVEEPEFEMPTNPEIAADQAYNHVVRIVKSLIEKKLHEI